MTDVSEPSTLRESLSAADALKLLDLTHACIRCSTEREFRALVLGLLEFVPFEHMIAISARLASRSGVVASQTVNVSYPDEFCREYLAREYFRVDPVMRDAFATGRAQYCCETTPGRPKEIVSLTADFGVREGYVLASRLRAPNVADTLLCFKSPSLSREARATDVLEFIAPHLQLAVSRVLHGQDVSASDVALSSREQEVISWLQQGKSSWEISVILDISERTVNFHVSNITRKLGAANRAQALAIAARLGLLR